MVSIGIKKKKKDSDVDYLKSLERLGNLWRPRRSHYHVYRKATEELGMQQCKRELTWKLLLFLGNFYGFG